MLWIVEMVSGRCQCFVMSCDDIISQFRIVCVMSLNGRVLVRVCHSSVPSQQSGQSPDLDPGPASLESFLESRVVRHVVARSLY